jgi:hypothetical protein
VSPDADRVALIERFLDDSIGAADARRLGGLLKSDPEFRGEFAAALRLRGLLRAALHPDAACDRLADVVGVAVRAGRHLETRVMAEIGTREVPRAARPRLPWLGRKGTRTAAAVAASWLLLIAAFIVFHEPPDVSLSAVGGEVTVERGEARKPGRAGLALKVGDTVRAPAPAWASLRYADGTRLELLPGAAVTIEGNVLAPNRKRVAVAHGTVTADVGPQREDGALVLAGAHAEARVTGRGGSLSLAARPESTRVSARRGTVRLTTPGQPVPVDLESGFSATAAPGAPPAPASAASELLRRLGRGHFMLGHMSGLGEKWIAETAAQGCRWDLRYQHLAPGWTRWNAEGAFVPLYLNESEKRGAVSVFSYYALIPSKPGAGAPTPAAAVALNAADRETMRRYLADLKLFMQKAGEYGKPVVLHAEPDVWGHFLTAPELRPNTPEGVRVAVRSTGLADVEGLDDTLASFGKVFGLLRDRYAPNVLLAWHASRRPGVTAAQAAEFARRCGDWDVLFTDGGDRDAGYRELRGGDPGAWWTERDFAELREWGREVGRRTGLPLAVWRIPLGNTVMAACNNTPWHYMDNRAEHWLEGYPANRRIAEWAAAGFVALLFGGGTVECTVHLDGAKDGVTDPAPIPGNRGESSSFPDDDGGYLRLRAGNYYRSGPLPLPGP